MYLGRQAFLIRVYHVQPNERPFIDGLNCGGESTFPSPTGRGLVGKVMELELFRDLNPVADQKISAGCDALEAPGRE